VLPPFVAFGYRAVLEGDILNPFARHETAQSTRPCSSAGMLAGDARAAARPFYYARPFPNRKSIADVVRSLKAN
jgi:hypothetical protein